MLHIACDKNNPLNIVQLLLDKGLTANDINKHNQTPLHFASRCINVEMMSLLINNGADPNACDIDGDTPLTFLMNTFENLFNVNCVTKLGKIEICLNLLLQNGANINQIGKSGQSSLFLVINGLSSMSVGTEIKLKFIKKLIDAGADINIGYIKKEVMLQKQQMYQFEGEEDFNDILYVNGDTPLHAAVHMGSLDVVIFLLEYNPDINHANCCKETAFDYATRHKYFCIRDEILFYIRKNIFQYFYDK
jgi:ankyrin repeat protein